MSAVLLFGLLGIALVGVGLYRLVVSEGLLRRVVAVNVLAVGVASVLVASAYRGPDAAADAAPHAFVLTGIVVLVSTTAAALALIRRIDAKGGDDR
jgi:multicomponent Na+:H+ antiporter subunit C